MRVTIIKNNVVDNVIEIESVAKAESMFPSHVCREAGLESVGDSFNPGTGIFTAPANPAKGQLSTYEFFSRFSMTEIMAFNSLLATDPVVKVFYQKLELSNAVFLDNPDTVAGLGYLVSMGIITENRKNEILK